MSATQNDILTLFLSVVMTNTQLHSQRCIHQMFLCVLTNAYTHFKHAHVWLCNDHDIAAVLQMYRPNMSLCPVEHSFSYILKKSTDQILFSSRTTRNTLLNIHWPNIFFFRLPKVQEPLGTSRQNWVQRSTCGFKDRMQEHSWTGTIVSEDCTVTTTKPLLDRGDCQSSSLNKCRKITIRQRRLWIIKIYKWLQQKHVTQ